MLAINFIFGSLFLILQLPDLRQTHKKASIMKEDKDFNRYTVTSALPYANGPIHIGHLAGVYVPADIYVRFLRMTGRMSSLSVAVMSMGFL